MEGNTFELRMKLNGTDFFQIIDTRETLLDVIRDRANLTGAKKGCDESACGACAILLDGSAVCSCTMLAVEANDRDVVTVEGLSGTSDTHPVQELFVENDAFQCGFCTSGQIISAVSLVNNYAKHPKQQDIREGMSGNVCRCGAYVKILKAVNQHVNRDGNR